MLSIFCRPFCDTQLLIPTLSLLVLFSVLFMVSIVPRPTIRPGPTRIRDTCDLLRGIPSQAEREAACRKRICIDVLSDAVRGKWRLRNDVTEHDIMYRKKMDAEIRLRMREPWPASLYRNDSR